MDIYLTDLQSNNRLRFPMLPERIDLKTGSLFHSYTIIGIGDVKLPRGDELAAVSWNGTLPGEARKNDPYVLEWRPPKEIYLLLEEYRSKRNKLRLMVTDTTINIDVYIESINVDHSGGYGDYKYDIAFVQARDLKIAICGINVIYNENSS